MQWPALAKRCAVRLGVQLTRWDVEQLVAADTAGWGCWSYALEADMGQVQWCYPKLGGLVLMLAAGRCWRRVSRSLAGSRVSESPSIDVHPKKGCQQKIKGFTLRMVGL